MEESGQRSDAHFPAPRMEEELMLVITLGDPYGVSVECLLRLKKTWAEPKKGPTVVVGSYSQWKIQTKELQGSEIAFKAIGSWAEATLPGLYFLDIAPGNYAKSPKELTVKERGTIAKLALESLKTLKNPEKLAVVTAPIDKFACAQAGFIYPGQTEFFCELWQDQGIMILAGTRLRVALATNHQRLADVPGLITEELICQKLGKLDSSLKVILKISNPRIVVAALNPHAGDQGLFGDEDQRIIAPAVERMRKLGMNVVGPKPADTIFFSAWQGNFDAVLAMYHDQGLGPLKTVHFYDAVNISGGLPHLRISPDHGPAGELYGKNLAKEDSFRLSLEHALSYLGW
ncbi:MAG: 4-hydroxythreonine-4-phosphate dehydrogenase PdxA [Proteobacteria bacterium]|nr:MAG: 4-hydroxythreonine-4-phosphate dehydrogenase PdxA [Pseudomonadota bacterium]